MGRKVAVLWHASFSIGAGVLFFYFVLPRWPELIGDTSHGLGNILRILTGALIGLAALPVVFDLLRTRKPELAVPQLALSIRTWSIVAHVLAGVLIIGTAISEFWINLDRAGQWLFAIYGAAAAVAVLGIFAFYLSFFAELPPPPPKPIKPKKDKKRRVRGKQRGKVAAADVEDDDDEDADEELDDEDSADETEDADADADAETVVAEVPETVEAKTVEAPAKISLDKDSDEEPAPDATTEHEAEAEAEATEPAEETVEAPVPDAVPARLRNRRPTGKTSHRRRRTRGGVTVEE